MATNVLREFLVSVGFKVDDIQLKKFEGAIKKSADIVESLGAASTVVAALIDRNVVKMAESYDKLYYSSQRIGSSVKNIQALTYAGQMFGVQADSMTSSMEAFARSLRLNPGLSGLLGQLGIASKGRDTHDVMLDFYEKLRGMQPYVATQYGSMFGQDPDTLNQVLKNLDKIKAAEGERRRMMQNAGVDPDRIADQSAEFERDMLRLNTSIEILKSIIAERFMPAIDLLVRGVTHVANFVGRMDKATGGASTYLGAGGAVVGSAAVAYFGKKYLLTKLLPQIGKALGLTGAETAAAAGETTSVAGAGFALAGAGAEGGTAAAGIAGGPITIAILAIAAAAVGIYELIQHWDAVKRGVMNFGHKVWNATSDAALKNDARASWSWIKEEAHRNPLDIYGGTDFHNPGNLRSWGNARIGYKGPKSGSFAMFDSDEQGLSAMAGQLLRYQSRHIDTITRIISTWAPKSDHNNTAAYIDSAVKAMHVGANQQLDLHNPAVLASLMGTMIHSEGPAHFSSAMLDAAIKQRLGADAARSSHVTIHQENSTVVHGSADPHATARAVTQNQHQLNQDLVRNVAGVVR